MTADIILRLMVAAHALYIPLAAVSRPWSLQADYLRAEGWAAMVFLSALAAAAITIGIDVVLNPTRGTVRWRWLTRHRRQLYLSVAVLSIVPAFSASRYLDLSDDILFFYGIIVVGALAMCRIDDRAKREESKCSK